MKILPVKSIWETSPHLTVLLWVLQPGNMRSSEPSAEVRENQEAVRPWSWRIQNEPQGGRAHLPQVPAETLVSVVYLRWLELSTPWILNLTKKMPDHSLPRSLLPSLKSSSIKYCCYLCSKGLKSNTEQVDCGKSGQTVANCSPPHRKTWDFI